MTSEKSQINCACWVAKLGQICLSYHRTRVNMSLYYLSKLIAISLAESYWFW